MQVAKALLVARSLSLSFRYMQKVVICRQHRMAVLLAFALVAWPSVALASTRTPAEATAHALNEFANCRAQQRPECPTETATPTPTPTWTPSPTSTSSP